MKGIHLVTAVLEPLDIETERPRILNVMFDNFPDARPQEVKKATLEDADMHLFMDWPEARDKKGSYSVLPYFDMRDVIVLYDAIIVKGKAVVRKNMKNLLHVARLG